MSRLRLFDARMTWARVRISANLDSDFGVIRTAVSVIANAIGAQATLDEYMVA